MERKVILSMSNISKTFSVKKKETEVIRNISLDVYENEFLVLLGPGRCGKSVLLNILAGLIESSTGSITFEGRDIKKAKPNIGMVYQRMNLMPWKTTMENAEFNLKLKGVDKAERRKKAQYFINLVGLQGFETKYPRQLSGGMKQRVGIARAYTGDPQFMIMDEPFGQLDAQTRYAMQNEILKIYEKEKRTIIFVTNNIEEAVYLGDRIIVMSSSPATVKNTYAIDLQRPRNMMAEAFMKLRETISNDMELVI